MFSHLTARLKIDVQTVQKAVLTGDALRNLLISHGATLSSLTTPSPGSDETAKVANALAPLLSAVPDKLDWQIYDHCAALTRLYAVYEQFVGDLVGEYVNLLPKLYMKYADLPECVTNQHRVGIGTILLKIGEKGPYKDLEEQVIVRELAAGLGGASGYTLLANAFFIERQNLRFDVLCKLFGTLGFDRCGSSINEHPAMKAFIKTERAENSTAEKELKDFIDYRNEAAHRKVENVLSVDAIGTTGRFLVALGDALADVVDGGVLKRRMELNHYSVILNIAEVHHNGFVVVGTPEVGVKLAVGTEIVAYGKHGYHRATLESVHIDNDRAVQDMTGDGITTVGLRLSRQVQKRSELRKLVLPDEMPEELQLSLEDTMAPTESVAETDLPEVTDANNAVESSESSESESLGTSGDASATSSEPKV